MKSSLFEKDEKQRVKLAVLVDPDKYDEEKLSFLVDEAEAAGVSFILYGGSLISTPRRLIPLIKQRTTIKTVLFPGSLMQIDTDADAIFLLSLLSGRNPEYLIGNHVQAAPILKQSGLEIIPVGYILVGQGGTSVEYISQTHAIPPAKTEIIVATALAGEMLGFSAIYLEGGSGTNSHVPFEAIRKVRQNISLPIIVGGGIKSESVFENMISAGADCIVLGTILEENPLFLRKIKSLL